MPVTTHPTRIQFRHVESNHWQWSDDYGEIWQEPEYASVEVVRAWFALKDASREARRREYMIAHGMRP